MRFSLKRPCKTCPFRSDIPGYLRPERAAEIVESILQRDESFTCHQHNDFTDDGEVVEGDRAQHCAGAMVFLELHERPNQVMRIAERLGLYDRNKLDMTALVFETSEEFENAQPKM